MDLRVKSLLEPSQLCAGDEAMQSKLCRAQQARHDQKSTPAPGRMNVISGRSLIKLYVQV